MKRLSIIYLTIPFFLFLFGWVRLSVALPLAIILLFALYKLLADNNGTPFLFTLSPKNWSPSTVYWLLVTVFWLLLSGIGGYAFQNWDHHWRNAVFRDLILFDHPIYFTHPERGPINMLVYYVGYWLPAAWIGKLLGWGAANFALFIWTLIGLLLVTHHLGNFFKTSNLKAALLLIFFSGLDFLGTLFFPQDYPTIIPPITHLETWAGNLQYSSFTTQLFWVFNQAIPAWLIISVIASLADAKQSNTRNELILLWSLCFFFAPLASLGLLPYILIEFIKQTNFKSPFKHIRWEKILAAIIIFLLSAFFFTSNTAAQSRGLQSIHPDKFIAFFLLEGGILWLILAPSKFRDPRWMVTGVLLAVIPFVQLGSDRDFVMRASIAPLFYLMLMTGETIFNKTTARLLLTTCYLLLLIGALTPLYEINRSIYRTYEYYFVLDDSQKAQPIEEPVTRLPLPGVPEYEHPNSLIANGVPTLKFMEDQLSRNFVANVRQTFFYRYLAKR
ncbi:MAG: hypothetical protein QY328_03530 [Anaerolineales bacterium]|nr:MAG: hypothetical protein QY328_03530 [Anaerolineales bacterium]